MNDSRIFLVFDAHFGERLRGISRSSPVWIDQSKDNDPIISELWNVKVGNITRFQPQDFDSLVGTLDEHHPKWDELEVIGTRAKTAEQTLKHYGEGEVRETAQVFDTFAVRDWYCNFHDGKL